MKEVYLNNLRALLFHVLLREKKAKREQPSGELA